MLNAIGHITVIVYELTLLAASATATLDGLSLATFAASGLLASGWLVGEWNAYSKRNSPQPGPARLAEAINPFSAEFVK